MVHKDVQNIATAVSGIDDGAVILASGFGDADAPISLFEALAKTDVKNQTIVSNNAGEGNYGLAALMKSGKVTKIICSYIISSGSTVFQKLYNKNKIQLDVIPQGTLSERMRTAGSGIGAFFTPTSAGTELGEGKETRIIEGIQHVL
jgi:3-oxoadipate CoA-transferase alpha subunit